MAQQLYAYTDIRHGARKGDGSVEQVVFKAGEPIKGVSDKELLKSWVEGGSVATYDRRQVEGGPSTNDAELRAELTSAEEENQRLREELEELRSQKSAEGQKS